MSDKRDASDVDLFGVIKARKRFADGTRAGQREWDVREEIALWPVVCACETERADNEAKQWLCQELNRTAKRADTHAPKEEIAAAERRIVQNRIVTRHIAKKSLAVTELAMRLFTGARTGSPLTWGEYHTVVRPYLQNPNAQDRIAPLNVLVLMDRTADDAQLVFSSPPPDDKGCTAEGRPARFDNTLHLASALRWVLECDPKDTAQLAIYWRSLWIAALT